MVKQIKPRKQKIEPTIKAVKTLRSNKIVRAYSVLNRIESKLAYRLDLVNNRRLSRKAKR